MIQQKLKWAPNLNTVIMVEDTLKNSDSIITVAQLKKQLPKKINHYALKATLVYLEESNKIFVSMKGITWIHNTNENFKKFIQNGFEL
jgi:gluconate kinase